jgi:hypothetical protein
VEPIPTPAIMRIFRNSCPMLELFFPPLNNFFLSLSPFISYFLSLNFFSFVEPFPFPKPIHFFPVQPFNRSPLISFWTFSFFSWNPFMTFLEPFYSFPGPVHSFPGYSHSFWTVVGNSDEIFFFFLFIY